MLQEIERGPLSDAMRLLPAAMDSKLARMQMLAICLQESGLTERVQRGGGPARGLGVGAQTLDRDAGLGGDLTRPPVDGGEGVEPPKVEQHLVGLRDAATDQTGVAALGHDRTPVPFARPEHGRHLVGRQVVGPSGNRLSDARGHVAADQFDAAHREVVRQIDSHRHANCIIRERN